MQAEPHKFNAWAIVQNVVGTLMVAAIIGLVADRVNHGRTMERHELLLGQLIEFKDEGGRFTRDDFEKVFTHIENEMQRLETGCGERHKESVANDVRQWKAIRGHIEKREHRGAGYRLDQLESTVGQCCRITRP